MIGWGCRMRQNDTVPLVTYGLLVVLAGIYALEAAFAVVPGPWSEVDLPTLMALGGVSRKAVLTDGEWYRVFTAPFLHGNIGHLIGNGFALILGGRFLEPFLGRLWFFALFILGGVGGSLMSLALNPPMLLSVGASGALMGLFAAIFVASFSLPRGTVDRRRLQLNSLQILIPSLYPLLWGPNVGHVDYAAHFGGAVVGALIGLQLQTWWAQDRTQAPFQRLAATIGLISVPVLGVAALMVSLNYPNYKIGFIPSAELPKTVADISGLAPILVAKYPNDPRSHLFLAKRHLASKNMEGAERELRTALALMDGHGPMFSDEMNIAVRTTLAAVLIDQGRQGEAKGVVRPICTNAADDRLTPLLKAMASYHLCDP